MIVKNRILGLITVLFLSVMSWGQQTMAIDFFEGSFDEALEAARAANKPVFIDAYAVWCAPCKRMDKDVFSQPVVGERYNEAFINIKIDMEKGEGLVLAEKYGVEAYPTFLFVDGEGAIIHRAIGFHKTAEFLELADIATDPTRQISAYTRKYNEGERHPEFLFEYAEALRDVMDPRYPNIVKAYLDTKDNWDDEDSRSLIMQSVSEAKGSYFDYLIGHSDEFIEQFNPKAYEDKVYQSVLTSVLKEDITIMDAEAIFKKAYPERSEAMRYRMTMEQQYRAGEFEAYAETAWDRHKAFPIENAMELNVIARNIYRHTSDRKSLKKGIKLAKASIDSWEQYDNLVTLGLLYKKRGKKRRARKTAQKAIDIADKMNFDAVEARQIIEDK